MSVQNDFDREMELLYRRTGDATGYWAGYYLREVRKRGGLAVAKRLLDSKRNVSDGFKTLVKVKRADLSVEALVLQPRFSSLFAPPELEVARQRLKQLPDSAFPSPIDPEEINPETLDPGENYVEGSLRRVTINAYERDPKARKACIRHHGTRCSVCDLDFGERYGEIGRGFIHVHHKRPLGLRKKGYKVDPKTHLIPVCPNCHAMLHSRTPPMDAEELRTHLASK